MRTVDRVKYEIARTQRAATHLYNAQRLGVQSHNSASPACHLGPTGGCLATSSVRILVVDDFELFRRFVASILEKQPQLQVICEVSDGLEAVQKAQELQPDLILLDIGLPRLNGIEAARRIREVSPKSKILFVSENRSWDSAEAALRTGALGYVVKSDAASQLLPGIRTVLQGRRFVSTSFAVHDLTDLENEHTADSPRRKKVIAPTPLQNVTVTRHHEVGFYTNDRFLLDDLTHFIGAALRAGNAAIVAATESHRESLLPRLQAYGSDIGAAIEQGRYIALDAADTLSALMIDDMPDAVRFFELLGNLIVTAAGAATKGEQSRVAIFGECVHLWWAQGNTEATIQFEELGNQLVKAHAIDILCGYSLGSVRDGMDGHVFQRICAEHSAVYSPRKGLLGTV
jgi:DNA-binding NarL/FixJ family response regulator